MEPKKKTALYFLLLIALNLVLIISAYALIYNVKQMLQKDAEVNLLEIATQNERIITERVLNDINNLKIIANQIASLELSFSKSEMVYFLATKASQYGYNYLYVSDTEGNAYPSKGSPFNVSGRLYFKKVLTGVPTITEKLVSRLDGKETYFCVVPIVRNDEIIGIIARPYYEEELSKIFAPSLFKDFGRITVFNASGDVLIHTKHFGFCFVNSGNYYRDLYAIDNKEAAEKIKIDLSKGESGFEFLKLPNGETMLSAHVPFEILEDWYLSTAVPTQLISFNGDKVVFVFLIVILFVFIMAAASAYFIIYMQTSAKKSLQRMAFVDPLTGGNTFNKFIIDSGRILSDKSITDYAVIKLDIDNFKYINELHGYTTGDEILKKVSDFISAIIDKDEVFARISADNFVLLAKKSTLPRLEAELEVSKLEAAGFNASLSFSYSAGVYFPSLVEEVPSMIDKATSAAKTIKGDTTKHFMYYTDDMGQKAIEAELIKIKMQPALKNKEFLPYYQPKYDVYTGKIVGAEVLVRWLQPGNGLVPPFRFIPVFEKTGFIVQLDLYMFHALCNTLSIWISQGITPVPISINFSRIHLQNPGFPDMLADIYKSYGLPKNLVEIEITESAFFNSMSTIYDMAMKLKTAGFIITMDDFGSGYSSFNMLTEIPMDVLKIDKEFLAESKDNIRRDIVIEHIVEMTKQLNIEVVAEGVETKEQVEFLQRVGCSIAQGYYYAKPMPSDEFERLFFTQLNNS